MGTTTEQLQIWEQTTIDGLCLATERQLATTRDGIYQQHRFWEDQLPELLRALGDLNLDLASLGASGERLLQALDVVEDESRKAYSMHLDCINEIESVLEDLCEARTAATVKAATGWRIEMMRELYGLQYSA